MTTDAPIPAPPAAVRTSMTGHATTTRTGLFSWALYEFAYGPFFITFAMFVFSPYLQQVIIGDAVRGQAVWGYVVGAAGLIVAIGSPVLGALNDAMGPRKPGIALFSALSFIAMCALWYVAPEYSWALPLAIGGYIIATVTAEVAAVLHGAMLPSIVSEKRVGALSGLGYALSYLAAVISFILWFLFFFAPEEAAFGLSGSEIPRIMAPLCAIWMMVFVAPFFVTTHDLPKTGLSLIESWRKGTKGLLGTLRRLDHYQNVVLFLIARLIYYDGMTAIFAFVGVYAAGIFGWDAQQIMVYAVAMLSVGIFSSIALGALDDIIGSKNMLLLTVTMFGVGLGLALVITPERVPWLPLAWQGEGAQVPLIGGALFALGMERFTDQMYVVAGIFSTFFIGPALASSRTLLSRIIPTNMTAEFFGLYNLTGKMTAFLGPLAIGIATDVTGDQRAGMSVIFMFLIFGAFLLLFVKVERSVSHE